MQRTAFVDRDALRPVWTSDYPVRAAAFLAGRPDAPWLTILANRTLTLLTNLLFGARITDMETCYKIMRTDVARSLDLESNRFDIEPEITAKIARSRARIYEVGISYYGRTYAEGKKIGWKDGVRAALSQDGAATVWQDGDQPKRITAPTSLIVSAFAPVTDIRLSLTPQLQPDGAALVVPPSGGRPGRPAA